MKNSYLALICGVLLFIVLSMAWCKPRPGTAPAGPLSPIPSSTPSPSVSSLQTPSPLASAPAVVLVSVFDASGKLLRTGTGFFVSDDGKLVAPRALVEGGVNAIASTAD